jgi:hypothetical protein
MTTASSHAFRTRIERLRGLDRASLDEQVLAGTPLWLPVADAPEAAAAAGRETCWTSTSGNDGPERSPQLQD